MEARKIRHDSTELWSRAVQPALWLLIFGEVFSGIRAGLAPAGYTYLQYIAPGNPRTVSAVYLHFLRHHRRLGKRCRALDQAHVYSFSPIFHNPRKNSRLRGQGRVSGSRDLRSGIDLARKCYHYPSEHHWDFPGYCIIRHVFFLAVHVYRFAPQDQRPDDGNWTGDHDSLFLCEQRHLPLSAHAAVATRFCPDKSTYLRSRCITSLHFARVCD